MSLVYFLAQNLNFNKLHKTIRHKLQDHSFILNTEKFVRVANYLEVRSLKLRHINLRNCEFVSETGLRFLIKHMNSLQSGGFQGMGMNPLSEDMMFQLTMFTPHLTTITLDTKDEALCLLAMCPNLTSINVELKDCLGIGFIQFLEQRGSQLVEVDVTYIDVEEGLDVQQGQFFNLAIVSVGQLAMNLRKLSLWGSGPVSSDAVRKMELEDKIGQYCPMNHNGYQD